MTVPSRRELETSWGFIQRAIARVTACLEGCGETELNWRPPAEGANSLYAIAVHVLANAEENLLGILCGQPTARQRADEFQAHGISPEPVRRAWQDLQYRIESALAGLGPEALAREYEHPRRGRLSGWAVLTVVARHAAEHMGQAELTRDLLRAAIGTRASPPTR